MSLCNIHLRSDRALIAVDSHGVLNDGAQFVCPKLLVLSSQQAIVTGRGALIVLQSVAHFAGCLAAQGFDELLCAMPNLLSAARGHELPDNVTPEEREEIRIARDGMQEVALVGWSQSRQRVYGMLYRGLPGLSDWQSEPLQEWCLAPGCPAADAAYPETVDAMVELARAQQREAPETIGGILRVATVERDRISLENVCDLGSATSARVFRRGPGETWAPLVERARQSPWWLWIHVA